MFLTEMLMPGTLLSWDGLARTKRVGLNWNVLVKGRTQRLDTETHKTPKPVASDKAISIRQHKHQNSQPNLTHSTFAQADNVHVWIPRDPDPQRLSVRLEKQAPLFFSFEGLPGHASCNV